MPLYYEEEETQSKTKRHLPWRRILYIILIAAIAITGIEIYALLNSTYTYDNQGSFQSVQVLVYEDSQRINLLQDVNWGSFNPQLTTPKTKIVYVYNNGTLPVTLNLSNNNFSPASIQAYITVSWNYTGETISPTGLLTITITVQVSPVAVPPATFSFQTHIQGIQA